MSRRRKKAEPELPLFDLPLFDEPGEGAAAADTEPETPAPPDLDLPASPTGAAAEGRPQPQPTQPGRAQAPEPSRQEIEQPAVGEPGLLFTEDDLVPVGPARDRQTDADSPLDSEEVLDGEAEDAPLQDRWLGGLADVTIHLATLGAMVLAVQLMGVPVALEDLPAFALLGTVFSFLYTIIPLAFWGQTPGMAWVGHLARGFHGEPLTFGQTFLRWLGALITVGLLGLPVLLALSGRSLCDRLSDSRTYQL